MICTRIPLQRFNKMAQQKFFSGLTEGMINRSASERPDRQKTHFYWPDEYADPDVGKQKKQDLPRARPGASSDDSSPARRGFDWTLEEGSEQRGSEPTVMMSSPQTRTTMNGPTSIARHERLGVDELDKGIGYSHPSSSGSSIELATPTRADRLQKNTASNIQFYDEVQSSFDELKRSQAYERRRIEQFLRQQSEEDMGEAARAKRLSTLQSKIEFYDFQEPFQSLQNSPPRSRTGSRQGQPESDTADLDFDDRSSIRSSVSSSSYALRDGYQSSHHLPEHKRNSQRHLRSSINFHNGCTIADDDDAGRKPVSVRESATTRVGVGLPNL